MPTAKQRKTCCCATMTAQWQTKHLCSSLGQLTHQGIGKEAVLRPGVVKKHDLRPKLMAKKMQLEYMKEQKNSKVLIVVSITLHTLLGKLSNKQHQNASETLSARSDQGSNTQSHLSMLALPVDRTGLECNSAMYVRHGSK